MTKYQEEILIIESINEIDNLNLVFLDNYIDKSTSNTHIVNSIVNLVDNSSNKPHYEKILSGQLSSYISLMDRNNNLNLAQKSTYENLAKLADTFQVVTPIFQKSYDQEIDNKALLPTLIDIGIRNTIDVNTKVKSTFTTPLEWNYVKLQEILKITKNNNEDNEKYLQHKKRIQKCLILGLSYFCLFIRESIENYFVLATYWLNQTTLIILNNPFDDLIKKPYRNRKKVKHMYLTKKQMESIYDLYKNHSEDGTVNNKPTQQEIINTLFGRSYSRDNKIAKMALEYYECIRSLNEANEQ